MARVLTLGIAVLVGAGCKFDEPPPLADDAAIDAATDAASSDAPELDAPSQQHLLTITIDASSTGTGLVRVAPGGFTCTTGTCMRMYDAGSDLSVTVEGTGVLDVVTEISGDCAASPCSLNQLDGDASVRVRFARLQCVPTSESCTAGAYTQCSSAGSFVEHVIPNGGGDGVPITIVMNDYPCPMGCHATAPRCADIDTGNAVVAALDAPPVSAAGLDLILPAVGAPAGTISIDANSFDAVAGEVRFNDTSGATVTVPAQVVTQAAPAPPVLVLEVRTFTLRAGSTLRVDGPRAFAIVSHFDMVIGGRLDVSAIPDGGPAFGEGAGSFATTAACAGQFLNGVTGGGSNGCPAGNGSNGAARGAVVQLGPAIVAGGCPGGRSTNPFDLGAGAGGALMLASRTRITLSSTALVDLSGAGGRGGQNVAYGGGSGGRFVLQAPSLQVQPGAIVAGRGGSGGAGGPSGGASGSEGPTTGSSPAAGAMCSGCGTGGQGGHEGGCGGTGTGSGTELGGGGGGNGRCNIFTRTGSATLPAGSMKLSVTENVLPSRSP